MIQFLKKLLLALVAVAIWSCDDNASKNGTITDFIPEDTSIVFKIDNASTNGKSFTKNGTISVTCKVTNTGDADGAEVVQVYVGKSKSKVKRAVKELKGFSKVSLKKGETQLVTISIPVETLAFYDDSISDWNIEAGDYEIYIGNASNNISKKLKVSVN